MAYNHLPKNLPSILRGAGLKVVELDGWHGRGRPASTGGFDPVGVLCHHTGSYDGVGDPAHDLAYAKGILTSGRSDLPGPLCQLALSAEGVVYVIASGRANHAGRAKASGSVAAGDGNELYIGIEAMNSGSQGWSKAQYNAYVTLCAVLSAKVTGNSVRTVRAHKETSTTGKWDPGQLDMDEFREDVAAKMRALVAPKPAAPARHSVMTWNVRANRSWDRYVLPALKDILGEHKPSTVALQECYDAPDLRGLVPGYSYRYQGHGYESEKPGYIEEHSANVILVRDGLEVKAHEAYEMELAWRGPQMGVMHDPRIHRRVTVSEDEENWRDIDVHGPFGPAKAETLNWARGEFESLAALDDPTIFIGDWNVDHETLKKAMGPLATVDGGAPDMVAYANCHKVGSKRLANFGSDHPVKIWDFEA